MTLSKIAMAVAALASLTAGAASASTVDTVQAPTGYFTPSSADTTSSPYYRGLGQDWEWQHNAITTPFTSASLWISAYDVDFTTDLPDYTGERDAIFALDDDTWTFLGYLAGLDNDWGYTTLALGSNFANDIATGLKVKIQIDTEGEGWYVSLAKSVLTTDGADAPPAAPGAQVPVPAAGWLLLAGMGGLAALRRRKQA